MAPPDKDGNCVFVDSYKISNVSHFVLTLVSKSKGERRYPISSHVGKGKTHWGRERRSECKQII